MNNMIFLFFIISIIPIIIFGKFIIFSYFNLKSIKQIHFENFTPKVSLLIPCRGIDVDFENNVKAFLEQNYPDYLIIFITNTKDDPAYKKIKKMINKNDRIILETAGLTKERSLKVNSLLKGLSLTKQSKVLVFADSDTQPNKLWLRNLVRPLKSPLIGATSGYPWHLIKRNNLSSWLLTLHYNIGAVFAMDASNNFRSLWGGSMAVLRETFYKAKVDKAWMGAYLDDSTMSRQIRNLGLKLFFVPECLTPIYVDCNFRYLLNALKKHFISVKVYDHSKWLLTGFFYIFNFIFYSSLIYLTGLNFIKIIELPNILFLWLIIPVKIAISFISLNIIKMSKQNIIALILPLVEIVGFISYIRSILTNKVYWRGTKYILYSPSKTEAIIMEE